MTPLEEWLDLHKGLVGAVGFEFIYTLGVAINETIKLKSGEPKS